MLFVLKNTLTCLINVFFLFQLIRTHFVVEEIPMEMHDELFRSTDIHIVKFTRR